MKIIIVIPTYNESANIAALVRRILALGPGYEALVVDDNSPDGTAVVVRELACDESRVHLLLRTTDRGLGSAVRAGFAEALRLGADFIGQTDADGSHDPAVFPQLLGRLRDGTADVMIGSRYLPESVILGWGLHRHANSRVANRLTWWFTRLPVADATNGLRLFRREVLEAIDLPRLRSRGYSIILETNYRAHRAGFHLGEVPITFHPRTAGESKMGPREVLRFCTFLLSLRLRSLMRPRFAPRVAGQ
jgi:dolichol-phosphate mannosyltransferase